MISILAKQDNLQTSFFKNTAELLLSIAHKDISISEWLVENCVIRCREDFLARTCYWLASAIDIGYPYNGSAYNNLFSSIVSTEYTLILSIKIFVACGGDLLTPTKNFIIVNNDVTIISSDKKLGAGTYGSVRLNNGIAVKRVNIENTQLNSTYNFTSFFREIMALSRLGRLKFVGNTKKHIYVGTEYYPLKSPQYPVPMRYFKDLTKELMEIHSKGIIHGDLCYQNACIDEKDHVKIIDFGSARFTPIIETLDGNPHNHFLSSFTDYSILLESAGVRPKSFEHSYEVDIWALGLIFYRMETGKKAYLRDRGSIRSSILKIYNDSSFLVCSTATIRKENRWTLEQILNYLELKSDLELKSMK